MTELDRHGAIDDPSGPGGQLPEERTTPPGDTADNTGGPGEPHAAELDLPGPDDPVAWNYVKPGTPVEGPNRERLGRVQTMLGTEDEGIFHGVAVEPESGRTPRVVPAEAVVTLTPSRVEVRYDAEQLAQAEEHRPT